MQLGSRLRLDYRHFSGIADTYILQYSFDIYNELCCMNFFSLSIMKLLEVLLFNITTLLYMEIAVTSLKQFIRIMSFSLKLSHLLIHEQELYYSNKVVVRRTNFAFVPCIYAFRTYTEINMTVNNILGPQLAIKSLW